MKTFLEELAAHLISSHGNDLKRITVVVPGKRAGLFLKRALHQNHGYSGWLPRIGTLSEILQEMSGKRLGDTLDLTFELFLCWREHFNKEEHFNAFLEWGPALLNDFNEVDHYLADARLVYRNLKAYKDIENWSFGEDENQWTDNQKRFADFWAKLGPTYTHFQQRMEAAGIYLGGTVARAASADPIRSFENLNTDHLIVAGLNALSNAEQKVLRKLKSVEKATILWDADSYYTTDRPLEAGHFLRDWMQKEPTDAFPSHFGTQKKTLHFAGCNSVITQMQYVHETLAGIPPEEAMQTAVVLPDNSVLPALLPAVPEHFDGINITMGKALSHTPYKSLIHQFFRLFDLRGATVRYSQLLPFLRHTLLSANSAPFSSAIRELTHWVIRENRVYVQEKHIMEHIAEKPTHATLRSFFGGLYDALETRKAADVLAAFQLLLPLIRPTDQLEEDSTHREQIHTWRIFGDLIQKMKRMYVRYPVLETPRDLERILSKLFGKLQIDLIGEPLSGLQIMGLLEARSLDFKRVILLNCNEGILPKQNFNESLLPFEIRAFYQLPSRADRDAIFGYYFYRLIQRATEVHMCYDAGDSTHKSGEKSRYLQQLEACKLLDPAIVDRQFVQVISESPKTHPDIPEVLASEWSENRLQQLFARGVSPSALNKWLACPADFYYQYVLGLREQDAVEEEMEHNTFGTILHEVLEKSYESFEGSTLQASDIEKMRSEIATRLDTAIRETYNIQLTKGGANYLICRVAERYLEKLYDLELKELPNGEVYLEKMEDSLEWQLTPAVKILGKADRIDRMDKQLRIIDYKSGKVDSRELRVSGDFWENLGKKPKAVQALMYAWMAYRNFNEPIKAGMISARMVSAGLQEVEISKSPFIMDHESADAFEAWLLERIQEISLTKTPAVHSGHKYCQYCVSLDD